MKIYTAAWSLYKGDGRVAVCNGKPKWVNPHEFKPFKELEPPWALINGARNKADYKEKYMAQLSRLNAGDVFERLRCLYGGQDVYLMCYETPPYNEVNYCHRFMIGEWLEDKLGIVVDEYQKPVVKPAQSSMFG